jgi:hypothetical protein
VVISNSEFILKPSRQFFMLQLVAWVSSILITCTLPVHGVIKLMLILVVSSYCGFMVWRYGLLRGKSVVLALKHREDNFWQLREHDATYQAELMGNSTVTPWVTVLQFRLPNQILRKHCVIFRDSLIPDRYRQLMVTVRMF